MRVTVAAAGTGFAALRVMAPCLYAELVAARITVAVRAARQHLRKSLPPATLPPASMR